MTRTDDKELRDSHCTKRHGVYSLLLKNTKLKSNFLDFHLIVIIFSAAAVSPSLSSAENNI